MADPGSTWCPGGSAVKAGRLDSGRKASAITQTPDSSLARTQGAPIPDRMGATEDEARRQFAAPTPHQSADSPEICGQARVDPGSTISGGSGGPQRRAHAVDHLALTLLVERREHRERQTFAG